MLTSRNCFLRSALALRLAGPGEMRVACVVEEFTGLDVDDAQARVRDFARAHGMPGHFIDNIASDYTSRAQIEAAVQALAQWYSGGLLILHEGDAAAWLFVPGAAARCIPLHAADTWLRHSRRASVMLYTPPSGSDVRGHVVGCHPTGQGRSFGMPEGFLAGRGGARVSALGSGGPLIVAGMQADQRNCLQPSSQRMFDILTTEMGFAQDVARRACDSHPDSLDAAADHAMSQADMSPPRRRQRVAEHPSSSGERVLALSSSCAIERGVPRAQAL